MFGPIGYNLARLARFSGRDTRETFWPYALTLFALAVVACALVTIPTVLDSLARMQRFAAEHPELATVRQGPGSYSIQIEGNHPELMPDMRSALVPTAVVLLAFVVLVAAATVRRLHDRGSSGAWALPPPLFLATGLVLMSRVMDLRDGTPHLQTMLLLFANNLLYLASLGLLIFLLARDGTPGPNRHGEDPIPAEVRERRRAPPPRRD